MKNLLKYLLVVIVAAVFWDRVEGFVHPDSNVKSTVQHVTDSQIHTSISASDSEICFPRQESFSSSHRVQSTSRRTNCTSRNNLEFTKSGKIINSGQRYFIQKQSIISHSSLIEPGHKLLSLGRLII